MATAGVPLAVRIRRRRRDVQHQPEERDRQQQRTGNTGEFQRTLNVDGGNQHED